MQPEAFQFRVDDHIEKVVYVSRLGRTTTVIVKFIEGATATDDMFRIRTARPPELVADNHGLLLTSDVVVLGVRVWKRSWRF